MNEQKILIKNTKSKDKIRLTVMEQLPKSTDEKIKVFFLIFFKYSIRSN